jgi:hypothetical protein
MRIYINKFLVVLMAIACPAVAESASFDQMPANRNPFKSLLPIAQPRDPIGETRRPPERQQIITPERIEAPAPIPQLTITGLVWNSSRPQAIVNGQVVNQGDLISGVKVIRIHKRGIDIAFNGVSSTIKP